LDTKQLLDIHLPILASSAFQNVPHSHFIISTHLRILIAQAFAVGGLMAWYMTIILEFGEDTQRQDAARLNSWFYNWQIPSTPAVEFK
jgi:hypothetical protein